MARVQIGLVITLFMLIPAHFLFVNGLISTGSYYETNVSSNSLVIGPDRPFDNDNDTFLRLIADTIGTECYGGHSIVTYHLNLSKIGEQDLFMNHYSETDYEVGEGWSTVNDLKMWVNVTDENGNRQLWYSNTTDNLLTPEYTFSSLGTVFPLLSNNTIQLIIGIQHESSFAAECKGMLEISEIWSESTIVNPPNISYSESNFEFIRGIPISIITPFNGGGEISSWSIVPDLPISLNFNNQTGEITGVPNETVEETEFTITAFGDGGESSFNITINIAGNPPQFTYPSGSYTFNQGIPFTSISPIISNGIIDSWSHDCDLPNGLEFNFSNGEITGTPLSITDVNCVISASNQDGVFNFSINFEVIIAPPNLLTDDSIHMFIIGYSNKSIIIDNIGGTASIWELIDDLPDGLDFSITNGIISGTPLVESEIKSYTIKASNEAGFDSIEITLQIVQPIPYFRYSDEYQFVKGDTITSISPEIIEGQSTNWQIQPSLPNGLMFNSVNGFISGTPHVISQSETYTVTATNSLGDYSDSFLISIVNDTQNLTNDSTSVGNEDNNSDSQNIDNQNTDAINDGEDDISTNQILIIIALFGIVIFFLQRDNNPEIHLTQTIHPAVVESTHTETSKIIWIEKNEREVVTRENEVKNEYGTVENYVLDKIKRLESLNELQYITSFQFPEDVMIEFEIVAARAYPILGPNPMKEAEAAEILKNELSNLTRVLGGATISPAVGSWLPVDKKYDLEWDKSISIRISLLANKFLEPNKFQSFIDAILDFSENHCQKFMQESVLISIRFDKQFGIFYTPLEFLRPETEQKETPGKIKNYRDLDGEIKYGYIGLENLESIGAWSQGEEE